MEKIYKLKLGQSFLFYSEDVKGNGQNTIRTTVLRVPGGWIFESYYPNNGSTQVFVPFNNEFQ